MKKILCVFMTLVLLVGISGCGCDKKEGEITVVLDWTPNTNHIGLYTALEKGFYEEVGLKVNIIQPPEGGAEMLVAASQAQFGISFQDSMAPALATPEPIDVVAVAAVSQHNLSGIISRGDKGIDSFKNMEGKSYATWGSPIEQAIIGYCMEKEGGSIDKLNMIDSTVTDVMTALETDMIDTVWVYEYWDVVKAKKDGYDYNYVDFKSVDSVMDYYTPVIISSDKYLNENSEEAKLFLQATKKGYEYAAEHPEEAAEILCKAAPELDSEMVKESAKFMAEYFTDENGQWGTIDPDRWNDFYAWLYKKGLVEKDLTGKGFRTDYLN
ncbi:MAG: ABC transporter substrate-binding protein [Clostridia bacterium]|nr:ABC transporter substrate-binding protein [Clostridia bacterium]